MSCCTGRSNNVRAKIELCSPRVRALSHRPEQWLKGHPKRVRGASSAVAPLPGRYWSDTAIETAAIFHLRRRTAGSTAGLVGGPFCRTFCSPFLACNFVSWHLRWWGLLHPLSEARELNGETRVFAFGERVQAPICVNRCSARVAPCRFETSFLPPCDCFWVASLHFWCARCVFGEGRKIHACPVVLVVA